MVHKRQEFPAEWKGCCAALPCPGEGQRVTGEGEAEGIWGSSSGVSPEHEKDLELLDRFQRRQQRTPGAGAPLLWGRLGEMGVLT